MRAVPTVRAFENGIYFVACNGSGSHELGPRYGGTWERMGRSRIIDSHGNTLAASEHDRDDIVRATCTRPRSWRAARRTPSGPIDGPRCSMLCVGPDAAH